MPRPIVFLDTETDSLNRHTRQAWDIAMIRREPDGAEETATFFVAGLDFSNADPTSLRMNHFYDRYDRDSYRLTRHPGGFAPQEYRSPAEAARKVERMTRGAQLVGAVPSFDEETLARLLREHGLVPAWHHRFIDVENLAEGWLRGRGLPVPDGGGLDVWARAVGVEPPSDDERHTAIGDALLVQAVYDAVTKADRP